MAEAFGVTQTQSKLWTPLHIRTTNNGPCTPEQTCCKYESILQSINHDNDILKQVIENAECEQKCLQNLLKDGTHWMGSVNGTQRKLVNVTINLENILFKLRQQNKETLKSIKQHSFTNPTDQIRPRRNSNQSSDNATTSSSSKINDKFPSSPFENLTDFVISQTTCFVNQRENGDKPYYIFAVKKANPKFWSRTARLIHVDLINKDVFVTYKNHKRSIDSMDNHCVDNKLNKNKIVSSSAPSTVSSIPIAISSSPDDNNTNKCNSNSDECKSVSVSSMPDTLLSNVNIQVTRLMNNNESIAKLVDFFRDPSNPTSEAILVFKCLKITEKEHDKLVFKHYLFGTECELIKCESLIYNHILGVLSSDEIVGNGFINKRILNTRKLSNIQIEVNLDDSSTRAARKLVKRWNKDGSKDKILQLNEFDTKTNIKWMSINATFIAVSTIKIILMLGCTIHLNKNKNIKYESSKNNKYISTDIEMKWLATATSRHIYSIWKDRSKVNNQYNSQTNAKKLRKYSDLSIIEKNRLIQETLLIIDHLIKDNFQINVPKSMHSYMF